MKMKMLASAVLAATLSAPLFAGGPINYLADGPIKLELAGTYASGVFDEGAAEIAAYDPLLRRLFVTNANSNTLDVISIRNVHKPRLIKTISLSKYGAGVNSVAVKNGIVAVAVEADVKQNPGSVVFFNRRGIFLSKVTVGALPDMVTFTPDGSKLLVANEGEPNDDYDVDPEGSVSIIDLSVGVKNLTDEDVTTAGFGNFGEEEIGDTRIFGPGASIAQDLEPEYITVSADSSTAYVVLQENNALAVVDIDEPNVTAIVPLGTKDFSEGSNGIDASDRDDDINIQPWPVVGMFQPDAIASYEVNGATYLVTANEGDARDYDGFSEETRVEDEQLDLSAYPTAEFLKKKENLGRLTITNATGFNANNKIEQIHAYGARSFSIWSSSGELLFDSGSEFERILANVIPADFNSDNDENGSFDSRSDAKGPEPEGVTVFEIKGRFYAAIGLERAGGIMLYDVTNPTAPVFLQYINNRNFSVDAELPDGVSNPEAGDLGPEGLLFIERRKAPFRAGAPLLVVTNEVSGTTSIYKIKTRN